MSNKISLTFCIFNQRLIFEKSVYGFLFGMLMPERKYQASSTSSYRYGFNGKENDNEVKGAGNQQDYGMRIYDPRLGKFLSVDPMSSKFAYLTPYQFASNRPIDGIDLDGEEWAQAVSLSFDFSTSKLKVITTNYIKVKVINQSTIITDVAKIRTKAELYKKAVEEKLTNVKIPLALPDNIIRTEVILDYNPPASTDLPTIGKLVFTDITTTKTVTTVKQGSQTSTNVQTSSVEGFTKGQISNFTISMGITRDGVEISDDDFSNTSQHETAHSGGLNHPWKLNNLEKQTVPELNQFELPGLINKASIKNNLLNSFENPDPMLKGTGTEINNKQLEIIGQNINQQSGYTPSMLLGEN